MLAQGPEQAVVPGLVRAPEQGRELAHASVQEQALAQEQALVQEQEQEPVVKG